VREHQGHDAVRLQHTPHFGKDGSHAMLVVAPGQRLGTFFALELSRVGYSLILLVG